MEKQINILVVDDDVAVCAALRLVLKRAGYNPIMTNTPDEALSVVRSASEKDMPGVVLMDMNFSLSTSGREGLELLRKIRIFTQTPVILMTAWASVPLAVEGMRLGAFDFVSKPWDNHRLLQTIETALRLSNKTAEEDLSVRSRGDSADAFVRELKNVVERTLLLTNGPIVRVRDVSEFASQTEVGESASSESKALAELEEEAIREALCRYDGNVSRAARSLGLSRAALYRRMEKYHL